MTSLTPAVALALFVASAAAIAADTVYKTVDPDGTVRYSDKPPDTGRTAGTLEFRHLPSSPLSESVLRFRAEMEKQISARAREATEPRRGEVRLFTAQWCPHCRRAKADLTKRGISYTEYDIETKDGMTAFIQASGRSVPLLVTSGARLVGYSEASYGSVFAPSNR